MGRIGVFRGLWGWIGALRSCLGGPLINGGGIRVLLVFWGLSGFRGGGGFEGNKAAGVK